MTHESEDPRDVLRVDGFAEPGSDLRVAWREKLAREGKLSTSGQSISDLVLRPTESH